MRPTSEFLRIRFSRCNGIPAIALINALVHSLLSFLLLSVCLSVISLLPSKWSLEISTQNAKYHLELQSPAVSLRLSHGPTKLANGCGLILSLTLSPLTTKKHPKISLLAESEQPMSRPLLPSGLIVRKSQKKKQNI
jgi:hypothetical protein